MQNRIACSRPFIIRMQWSSAAGHAVVLSGYDVNRNVTIVGPAEGCGIKKYSFSALVNDTVIQSGTGKYVYTWEAN